jgi:hypothetical protein
MFLGSYVSFLLYLHQIAEGQWKDQIWQGFHFPTQKNKMSETTPVARIYFFCHQTWTIPAAKDYMNTDLHVPNMPPDMDEPC